MLLTKELSTKRMKREIYNKKIKTQILLIPVVIDLNRSTLNALIDSLEKVKTMVWL